MRGEVLALGAMGALALAAGSERGARSVRDMKKTDRPWEAHEFPWFTVGTTRSFSSSRPSRVAWPAISADTAKDWMEEMKSQNYVRIDYTRKPSRGVHISDHATSWLMRDGTLAPDVDLIRTLGGAYLQTDHDILIPVKHVPANIRRRIESLETLRRHKARRNFDFGHRAAISEMAITLAAMPPEDNGFEAVADELAWIVKDAMALAWKR
jgi:hypothetical protein